MGLEHLEAMLGITHDAGAPFEYGADRTQLKALADLAARPGVGLVCEIGFNAGFSSWAFLQASPSVRVCSFDLAHYVYSRPAKAHIDELFPGRHTLIPGDSRSTVPRFVAEHPGLQFDLLFIDGDHTLEGARADLENLRPLAAPGAMVVMDDITPWEPWGVGPTRAWLEAVEARYVAHRALFRDGVAVATIEPPASRSWAVGQYVH